MSSSNSTENTHHIFSIHVESVNPKLLANIAVFWVCIGMQMTVNILKLVLNVLNTRGFVDILVPIPNQTI